MEKSTMFMITRLLALVVIALYVMFLTFVLKLEKIGCECALTWRRWYILIFSFIYIIANIFILVNPQVRIGFLAIPALLFYIFSIQYVNYLRKEKCECSEDYRREVLYWTAVISLILFVLVFVATFSILFIVLYNNKHLFMNNEMKLKK
jgi:hypothetical protein